MAGLLTNLGNNFDKWIHEIYCKYDHIDKKCETWGTKYKVCECCLQYTSVKEDLIKYKCCHKNYQRIFDENIKKWLDNTYKFSNHHISKCILILQKCVHQYGYMEDWEIFNDTITWKRRCLQSPMLRGITDADYTQAKRVWKNF